MKKYKPDIIFFSSLTVFLTISYFLAEIVLPFFIGLALAFVLNPIIKKIQKFVPNRNIAVALFLILVIVVSTGSVWVFANQISNDFNRLNTALRDYAEDNSDDIDRSTKIIKSYIGEIYSPEDLKEQLGLSPNDSLNLESLSKKVDTGELIDGLDTEAIKESFSTIVSFFQSGDDEKNNNKNLNWFIVIFSSIGYFIYIIFSFGYFDEKLHKYFGGKPNGKIGKVVNDFKNTFLSYFKQRGKIVIIYTFIFTTAFFIIGVPGALLFGIVAGLLCFIPYLQYLVLIPLSMSCLVLSMEQSNSFYIYFGIILGVFILSSILEELVLFPRIMKGVASMNPAIMMVSISVWTYLLGLFGLLIALPLTSFILIYINEALLYRRNG